MRWKRVIAGLLVGLAVVGVASAAEARKGGGLSLAKARKVDRFYTHHVECGRYDHTCETWRSGPCERVSRKRVSCEAYFLDSWPYPPEIGPGTGYTECDLVHFWHKTSSNNTYISDRFGVELGVRKADCHAP